MENLEDIINRCKNKHNNKEKKDFKYNTLLTKLLLSVIFLFASLIFVKISDDNKNFFIETFFTNSMSFTKINSVYEKYFGEVLPSVSEDMQVFNSELVFKEIKSYKDGEVLNVDNETLVANLIGGVVVFTGVKDGYGEVVIVQGNDGYDIWYGNLMNINVNVYDYIEKETILGQTVDDNLYLVIKKGEEFIKYEDYKN